MHHHDNSQKRIYRKNAVYFITANTHLRYPYFREDIFCELFIQELHLGQQIHGFKLFAYTINPDHVHLLIQPNSVSDYSKIMHFLKRNFSRNINKILFPIRDDDNGHHEGEDGHHEGEDDHPRLHGAYHNHNGNHNNHPRVRTTSPLSYFDKTIKIYFDKFKSKYGGGHPFPKFKWQESFYDHIIRDDADFYKHVQYIKIQWIKHGLVGNKWCYVLPRLDSE